MLNVKTIHSSILVMPSYKDDDDRVMWLQSYRNNSAIEEKINVESTFLIRSINDKIADSNIALDKMPLPWVPVKSSLISDNYSASK